MGNKRPLISIVVPVYNEIGNVLNFHNVITRAMHAYNKPYEVIYVDDNSSDGTYEWLTSIANDDTVKVIRKKGIQGKAYSLIEGFAIAQGDVFAMIDGDLQYPPQKIPEMVSMLREADIVVGNRKDYNENKLRKFVSGGFRKVFGQMMFGLSTDIQSGLKVFTRQVYEVVQFKPVSPWTFDLEFLARARHAGFIIENVGIVFAPRVNGESKVNIVKQSIEIGTNALAIKMKKFPYFHIQPEPNSMRGAGVGFNKRQYITHTTLPDSLSAIQTFSTTQKVFFIIMPFIILASLIAFPINTARIIVAVLSLLYFVDAVFYLYIVSKSLTKQQEIDVTDEEINNIDESKLPVYTILCPLYKEAHVAPQFLDAISKMDWPLEKLDVMFLLEENDIETIEAFNQMHLPYYARTVIVPDSQPKTKPKACNYGLTFAKGEYLVIFDAEDIPEPQQLKKVYLGFQKVPKSVKCLQAKLSYYNSRYNLLTRFFTAEYALWFDMTLPGLQSLNSALPLGGTSNHFKTENLLELKGWDPFNVTEDADLGVRLFQKGYRTAVINSNTYEEATSVNKNWLRQRSRWLKGYMQTYLVHMRNVVPFIKTKGIIHNLIFQLNVGGKILFVLLNPFMWVITLLYFVAYPWFGPTMKAIYVAPISYFAVTSWIFGNFMFLYVYMIAVAKRKQWDLAKYIFLIPLYWLMMSTAAMIAFYQLIFKPHYWEKTLHGFHLGRSTKEEKSPAPAVAPKPAPVYAPTAVDKPTITVATKPSYAEVQDAIVDMPAAGIKKKEKTAKKRTMPAFTFPTFTEIGPLFMRLLPFLVLFNLDLVLAKVYLPADNAQIYLLMSLFAKAVYIINHFVSGYAAALFSKNTVKKNYFNKLIFMTFLVNWVSFAAFGLEGRYTLPVLFGNTFATVYDPLSFYLFGLFCYGIVSRFNANYLTKNNYTFTVITIFTLLMQIPLYAMHHDSLLEISKTFAYLGSLNLFFVMLVQMVRPYIEVFENNYASMLDLFNPSKKMRKTWKPNAMKILIFNWRDTKHTYAGGAEVYVQELAQRWVKDGNKVTLFCGNDNNSTKYEHVNGVEIYRRGGTFTVYIFAILYYFTKFRGKYDIIVDCENGIPFFMPLFAKEQVILLIHHVHQDIFRKFLPFPLNMVAKVMEGKLMPVVYQDKPIITVSESSKKGILALGFAKEENIEIIPNGVTRSMHVDYPKTDYPSYVYLGRLKEYKNIDVAIEAFAKVLKIHKNAKLSIVGTGEMYEKLASQVEKLGIANAVTFYGRVSEKEKAQLLSQSWAAIQPSQMEGWGITVIEANAAGTPVIASKVSGLKDSVIDKKTGLLIPVGDVAWFAVAMRKLAEDYMLRFNLTHGAREWAKNFDWDQSAKDFYEVIGKNFRSPSRSSMKDIALTTSKRN